MASLDVLKILTNGPIIQAARSMEVFKAALTHTIVPSVVLLFGDINSLPVLISQAKEHKKRIILHLDLFDGIGKDKAASFDPDTGSGAFRQFIEELKGLLDAVLRDWDALLEVGLGHFGTVPQNVDRVWSANGKVAS